MWGKKKKKKIFRKFDTGSSFKMSKQCFEELTCLLRKATLSKWKRTYLFLNFRWPLEKKCVKSLEHRLRKDLSVCLCLLSLLGYIFDMQENASIKYFFLPFCLSFLSFHYHVPTQREFWSQNQPLGLFFLFSMSQHLKAGQLFMQLAVSP